MEMYSVEVMFTAQAQRFVRSAVFCAFPLFWRLESGVFGVLDVAVPLGFAFQDVASKICFRDKSQLETHKSVLQQCPKRMPCKSFLQE